MYVSCMDGWMDGWMCIYIIFFLISNTNIKTAEGRPIYKWSIPQTRHENGKNIFYKKKILLILQKMRMGKI